MIELKFRAYDTEIKTMLFADIYEMQDIQGEWTKWDKPIDSPINTGMPFDIMQFTGLNDKNGVKAYEDDLFHGEILMGHPTLGSSNGGTYWVKCLCKIEFIGCSFKGVAIKQLNNLDMNFDVKGKLKDLNSSIEIIGNFHQNNELLKANFNDVL